MSEVMSEVSDKVFLQWLIDRLVHHYGENPNVDFVHRLREIMERASSVVMD